MAAPALVLPAPHTWPSAVCWRVELAAPACPPSSHYCRTHQQSPHPAACPPHQPAAAALHGCWTPDGPLHSSTHPHAPFPLHAAVTACPTLPPTHTRAPPRMQLLPLPFLRAGYLTAAVPSTAGTPDEVWRRDWFVLDHASLRSASSAEGSLSGEDMCGWDLLLVYSYLPCSWAGPLHAHVCVQGGQRLSCHSHGSSGCGPTQGVRGSLVPGPTLAAQRTAQRSAATHPRPSPPRSLPKCWQWRSMALSVAHTPPSLSSHDAPKLAPHPTHGPLPPAETWSNRRLQYMTAHRTAYVVTGLTPTQHLQATW